MRRSTYEKGNRGEALAAAYLKAHGFEIVRARYRAGRGDIDIVAREGEILVFCEVKARDSDLFGEPEHAVTRAKQRKIRRIAEAYLFEHDLRDQVCRFDVIAIRFPDQGGGAPRIRHHRNAF